MNAPARFTSADITSTVDALGERHAVREASVQDWRRDDRAVALLDSIRRNPPRLVNRTATYVITRDEWSEYVGQRVDRLESIYGEYETCYRLDASATECWDSYDAFSAFPTPQRAINEALNPAEPIKPAPVFDMMMSGVIDALRPQWSRTL